MKVAKETSYAAAEEAIGETIEGKTSGPAAAPLRRGLAARGLRRGEDVFKTSTLRETAEVLTFNGHYWSLGSGLIDQSQKITAAAMQMAEKKVWAHRSYRVAMRRQSLSLANRFSIL